MKIKFEVSNEILTAPPDVKCVRMVVETDTGMTYGIDRIFYRGQSLNYRKRMFKDMMAELEERVLESEKVYDFLFKEEA